MKSTHQPPSLYLQNSTKSVCQPDKNPNTSLLPPTSSPEQVSPPQACRLKTQEVLELRRRLLLVVCSPIQPRGGLCLQCLSTPSARLPWVLDWCPGKVFSLATPWLPCLEAWRRWGLAWNGMRTLESYCVLIIVRCS